jgi:DNA-binding response OmpR family regulator
MNQGRTLVGSICALPLIAPVVFIRLGWMTPNSEIRVLLVDDDQDLADAYCSLLESLGFSVQVALNGEEAWGLLQNVAFDIVLTDIKMPKMNGVDLLKKIRAKDHQKPFVILMSGFSDFTTEELFDLGVNEYLDKPISARLLRDAFNSLIIPQEKALSTPFEAKPAFQLNMNFESFTEMLSSKEVQFGRGGFCAQIHNPEIQDQSIIGFSLSFSSPTPFSKIEGVGIVRWVHHKAFDGRKPGLGIEIRFLAQECRSAICEWISEQKFKSYIPMLKDS